MQKPGQPCWAGLSPCCSIAEGLAVIAARDHPTASEEPGTASRRRPAGNGGPRVTACKGLYPPNHQRNWLSLQTQPSLPPTPAVRWPSCAAGGGLETLRVVATLHRGFTLLSILNKIVSQLQQSCQNAQSNLQILTSTPAPQTP